MKLVGTGDSIMVAKHAGHRGFLEHYRDAHPEVMTDIIAESGSYIQWSIDRIPAIRAGMDLSQSRNVVLINTCTNNINNANPRNWTATDFAAKLVEHMQTLTSRLLGYHPTARVVINTVIARRMAGTAPTQKFREEIRVRFNDMLRQQFPEQLADIAALPEFAPASNLGEPSNNGCYVPEDMTHLLTPGYEAAAPVVNSSIDRAGRE